MPGKRSNSGRESRPAVPEGSPIDLHRYVPSYITLIGNRWSRSSSSLYLKRFGIGIVEWRLMVLLAIEPWIQASRVDEVIGLDKAAVSRSLRLLEKRGLAVTRPNSVDPRRREMALTSSGRQLHDEVAALALARERNLLAGLSSREKDLLLGLLGRLQENLAILDGAAPARASGKPGARARPVRRA